MQRGRDQRGARADTEASASRGRRGRRRRAAAGYVDPVDLARTGGEVLPARAVPERRPERVEVRRHHDRRADAARVGDERHAAGRRRARAPRQLVGRSAGRSAQQRRPSRRAGSRRCISAAAWTSVPFRSLVAVGDHVARRGRQRRGPARGRRSPPAPGRRPVARQRGARRCPRRRRRRGRGVRRRRASPSRDLATAGGFTGTRTAYRTGADGRRSSRRSCQVPAGDGGRPRERQPMRHAVRGHLRTTGAGR